MTRRGLLASVIALAQPPQAAAIPLPLLFGGSGQKTRNIASNIRVPGFSNGGLSDGTNTYALARLSHFNESGAAVSAVALIYSNWYTTASGAGEANGPNSITVQAVVEYPSGTFNNVTWAASSTISISPGANSVSDTLALAIPAGAQFWTRTLVTVASGKWPCSWPSGAPLGTGGLANTCQTGTGTAPAVTQATVTGTATGLGPSAILGTAPAGAMNRCCAAGIGDSIMAGASDGNVAAHGNTGTYGRGFDSQAPFINASVTGTTAANQVGNLAKRIDLFTKAGITHIVVEWATNDINAGASLSTLQGNIQSIWSSVSAIPGVKIIANTVGPRTTSTDGWNTVANQTPASAGFTGGSSSIKSLYNAWIRGLPAPLYDYIELNNVLEAYPLDSGAWIAAATGSVANGGVEGSHQTNYQQSNTLAAGSTTTVITTGLTLVANRYNYGYIKMTSGVDSGVQKTISSHTTGGVLTLTSGFASAPAAGDSFLLWALTDAVTTDGIHPAFTAAGMGGIVYGSLAVAAKVATWL